MEDERVDTLLSEIRLGGLSRRDVLVRGLALGLSAPVIATFLKSDGVVAAPASGARSALPRPQGESGGTFTYLRDGSAPDIDPHYAYDNAAACIILGAYEMLIQYKGASTDQYDSMLAESWEGNDDQSVFTFKLYSGVTFHDGDPCTAQSVKDSFNRCILQKAAVSNVITRFVPDPSMIEVVDDLTVRFNLGKPQPLFLAAMAASYGPFIINTKYVDENKSADDPWAHEWFRENAVGTGPYKVVENSPTEQVRLEKFDGYHRGWEGPHFDKIVCRIVPEVSVRRQLVETGEADATTQNLTPEDVEALKSNAAVQIVSYDSTAAYWTIMNAPRMKTKEVRQGFSYAFPYDDVINGVYKGLVKRSGPLASTVRASDPNVFLYQTNLDKAKTLILSGGFKEGDSFDYYFTSGDEVENTISQLFQGNVQKMGFGLEITAVERGTLIDLVYGSAPAEERPMFIGGWSWWPDYNDPWNQLFPNFVKASTGGGGSNGGYYVNDRFEEIMSQAEHFTDEAQLETLMNEAQNILTEQDPPAIFYGQPYWTAVMNAKIQGFVGNPLYLSTYPLFSMSRSA